MTVYTVSEVAELFQVDGDTVRAWIVSGRLKALNLAEPGKRAQYRVTEEQLADFQARCTVVRMPIKRRKRAPEPRRRWLA
jgi:excisionase family DNA binding protein